MQTKVAQISGKAVIRREFGGAVFGLNSARHNAHVTLMSLQKPLCRNSGGHTDECNFATDMLVERRLFESLKGE